MMENKISTKKQQLASSLVTADVATINNIKDRFTAGLSFFNTKEILLNPSYLSQMFTGIKSLTESEISVLSEYMRKKIKTSLREDIPQNTIYKLILGYFSEEHPWHGRTYVGEENGAIYIVERNEKKFISTFVLVPKHTIVVEGKNGNLYGFYDLIISGRKKKHTLMLRTKDFNNIKELQSRISEQIPGSMASINNCNSDVLNSLVHKYFILPEWGKEKIGTSLLGMEVLADGKKYFCTGKEVYNLEGTVSNDIVSMGNEASNREEIKNWTNLSYNADSWPSVVKGFLENALQIADKNEMSLLLGWMGAIPHDYVLRKESKTNYFPHCQVVGEPGAGKSTIMTLMKQYMGHNDSSPRSFPSSFELGKLLNSSYTIPVVLDEYGKRWTPQMTDAVDKILVESFTRPYYSKGTANQDSIYYKFKNAIMYGGQKRTSDKALSERVIDINIQKSFHNTSQGKTAYNHIMNLQKQEDKNFWVGYNLWCAKHPNSEVLGIFNMYREKTRKNIKDKRISDVYAITMLGLHFLKKLSDELGVSFDLSYEEIGKKAEEIGTSTKVGALEESNLLREFLSDVAQLGVQHGNNKYHGRNFGTGLSVAMQATNKPADESGVYGQRTKNAACVYGNDLLLIKVKEMVDVLNRGMRQPKYDDTEIMTFIDSEFSSSLSKSCKESNKNYIEDRKQNLVLAPNKFRTKYGAYTALNYNVVKEEFPAYEAIHWI